MTFKSAIRSDGSLPLGEEAKRLGFAPGAVVQIITTRAGSIILAIDTSHPLDLPPMKALPVRAKRVAIGEAWRR